MTNASPTGSAPARILYIASDDRFFASHFLHIAKAAQDAGYAVGVAARFSKPSPVSEKDFEFYPLQFNRGNRSVLAQLAALPGLFKALRNFRPGLVHVIGLHAILVFAPLIAVFSTARLVLAPIGLGKYWTENNLKASSTRLLIKTVLRILRGPRFFYVFENEEDAAELGFMNYPRKAFVGGAGIDKKSFILLPEPAAPPVKCAVVSRMLQSKGILETVAAVRQARSSGAYVTLDLWGAPDAGNAASLTENTLRALSYDGVAWCGVTKDVRAVWRDTHIAILLSAREGLPKSLLEAAACGRPIVATDVPGCRTLVRDGQEGLLVPFGDIDAAAHALLHLAKDEVLRKRLGAAARARIEKGFTEEQVQVAMLTLYEKALKRPYAPR